MIEQYNKLSLADFFDYNDPSIRDWANNVYEKIRQTGELAGYVERDKIVRQRFDVEDGTTLSQSLLTFLVDSSEFTFGNAYRGTLLNTIDGVYDNLGRRFQVEFEIMFNDSSPEDVNLLEGYISIKGSGIIVVGNISFIGNSFTTGKHYNIKILRENLEISLFIDGVLISKLVDSQDTDTQYTILYQIGTVSVRVYDGQDYSNQYS